MRIKAWMRLGLCTLAIAALICIRYYRQLSYYSGLADWPKTLAAMSDLAQICAVVVAGFWTYRLFKKQRHGHCRANLDHVISHLAIDDAHRLLGVTINIQNIGSVRIEPPKCLVLIRCVIPAPDEILDQIRTGCHPVQGNDPEIQWPIVADNEILFKGVRKMVLDPGEVDHIHFDFILPKDVTAVRVVSVIPCGESDAALSWVEGTYYDFSGGEAGFLSTARAPIPGRLNLFSHLASPGSPQPPSAIAV